MLLRGAGKDIQIKAEVLSSTRYVYLCNESTYCVHLRVLLAKDPDICVPFFWSKGWMDAISIVPI